MNYEEKTVSKKHIYTGKIISVDLVTVTLPDGRQATRDIVTHPGASAVVPINENGEIYMVRQYRKPIERVSLEIPAGKLDAGEDPRVCAERELKEETGLSARNMIHIASIHSTPGFSNEILHLYAATGLREGESCADSDEFISTERFSVAELTNMISSGEITDGKSIIGILLADRIVSGKLNIEYKE
jgi:ADP-ribose pyrophosphatase